MALPKSFKLSSGYEIPAVGLGTGGLKGDAGQALIEKALNEFGYRHLDTAEIYGNEVEVGNAIKNCSVPREEIIVATKAWPHSMHPDALRQAFDQSLQRLQVDYVDLYLMHWPVSFVPFKGPSPINPDTRLVQLAEPQIPIEDTWKAMEQLVDEGKIRSIGVSNFTIPKLEKLLQTARIKPVVNQVECHPTFQQEELLKYCKHNDIVLVGYTPLGRNNHGAPRLTEQPKIIEIAKSLDIEHGNVLISWAVQRGTSPIPKSTNEQRLKQNFQLYELPENAMNEITKLKEKYRAHLLGIRYFWRSWW
jgi:diketogulonate reductase-like aldo/keto reductase